LVHFSRLRLTGFKSFVDSTDLLIESGVTGIVGPNGCGKSNLVEALRWAMGENSPKSMRGSGMEDVIFGGSGGRPARNIAEVSLHLDNSHRKAPAAFNQFDEIEVIRRIERGKGSTYRVNGKEVRARDVQLLFADNATGAHSPAIVSQGRIGTVINAKPEDRRSLLEEAAGITGLHSRRHEAELRLRAAETNLERLDDVIGTLNSQLQVLKRQARQATRYRNIAGHLRRQEAIFLYLEAEAARSQMQRTAELLEVAEQAVAELTQKAAVAATAQGEAASALPPLREAEAAAAAGLQRLRLEQAGLDREQEQAERACAEARERQAQLRADRERSAGQAVDAGAAAERLDAEETELKEASAGEQAAIETAQNEREARAEEVKTREQELTAQAEALAGEEARLASHSRQLREAEQRVAALRQRLTETERQIAECLAQAIPDQEVTGAEEAVRQAEAKVAAGREEAERAEQTLAAARTEESAANDALQDIERQRATLEAEAAALTKLLRPSDSGLWPPVVDAVTIQPGYETALGAALGDELDASTDQGSPRHWQNLPPLSAPAALPAGCEPLSARVTGVPALARRLSQIGLVADTASGERLQSELKPGQRLVTRDGALWRWDGFAVKAGAPTAAAQRLEQRNRLAELEESLREGTGAWENAKQRATEAREQARQAGEGERALREALRSAFSELDRAREALASLGRKAAAADARLTGLKDNQQQLTADAAEAESGLAGLKLSAEEQPDIEGMREALQQLRLALSERRAALTAAESDLQSEQRAAQARRERLGVIAGEREAWTRRKQEAERHCEELDQRLAATEEEVTRLAAIPGSIGERRDALLTQITEAEARRNAAADRLAEAETLLSASDQALKQAEQALAGAREERIRAEGAVEQAQQAMAMIKRQVADKLECDLDGLAGEAELSPDQPLPLKMEVERKIERLTRERDNMGPVNLRAEAEAEELQTRIDGMEREREDLIAAISRLRQGISSLNREGRERLLVAFEQVDKHFNELFVRLFGGGRAHLKLTESDDPLNAGLEIMASPPGKRLQVLSLLSGGEQALTALSLLFAVFLTNPAPICVLDEVDAPLDDNNVERFCNLLEELTNSLDTRFLLVTHHRLTMARVDRLFGVTMAERGVSQLVSVDLEAAERLREAS